MLATHLKLTASQATGGLVMFVEAGEECRRELDSHNYTRYRPESDEKTDSDASIFELFYNAGGSKKIIEMNNFPAKEFQSIWGKFSDFISTNCNVERVSRSQFTSKEVSYMNFALLKHAGAFEFVDKALGIS